MKDHKTEQGSNKSLNSSAVQEHHHDEHCGCGHSHADHAQQHEDHSHIHKECSCGCGHEHDNQDHEEHHHSHEECTCGCDHEHDNQKHEEHHHSHEECACGCDHEHNGHEHNDQNHEEKHHSHSECTCGCDHEHDDHVHDNQDHEEHHRSHPECACGCDHSHEDDAVNAESFSGSHTHFECLHIQTPGHPEDCTCELCNPHVEYCDVCGESLSKCTCRMPDENNIKKVYLLENLGCANCAAKMERKIKDLPDVSYAAIAFATKQLRVSAPNPDALLPRMQEICASIEPDVKIVPRGGKTPGIQVTNTYTIEELDCANCAAKIERMINNLPEVTSATVTYATKQLRITAKDPDKLIPEIQKIAKSIEPDVVIKARDTSPKGRDILSKKVTDLPKRTVFFHEHRSIIEIIVGALLLIAAKVMESKNIGPTPVFIVYAISYLVLGWKIVWTAIKNIAKGHVFDENFLMSIATIGAFVISDYAEAIGVMLFYRVGEYFEDRAVEKSRSQIMNAVDMRPEVVNLAIGDEVQVIPAGDAQVGDILVVRPGDRIPLDGVIIEGESRIDTSPVTGEPVPVKAGYGDEVTSGCMNTSGLIKIRVEKVLEDSMVTRILDSVENAAASKPKIDRFITRFARIYTPFVVALAVCTAIIPSLITGDWNHWIYTALTFLVISCPCALVLSVPLAFFSGIGAGSKRGILFKGGVSLEALKDVTTVIMDKTGTITEGNFQVQHAVPANGFTSQEILKLAAICELDSTHPIGTSIVSEARNKKLELNRPASVEELAGKGIHAVINGRDILCGNQKLMDAYKVSLKNFQKDSFGTEVLIAVNGTYAGHIVISDTVKADAAPAIKRLKSLGITTAMLTGDALDSANAVAKETGIDEVHAKLLPQEKLTEMQKIRDAHGRVMFVGDGINDAPVLAGADVGAAMGSGADAAIEAADVVFMNSSVTAIPDAIAIARSTGLISRQNVIFALVIKILVMILGLMGFASMWMAVFADSGVAMLCVLNSVRILYKKK